MYFFPEGFTPDVYFRPQEVWEIRGAEYVFWLISFDFDGPPG